MNQMHILVSRCLKKGKFRPLARQRFTAGRSLGDYRTAGIGTMCVRCDPLVYPRKLCVPRVSPHSMASCHRSSVQTSSTTQRVNALRASNIGTFTQVPPDLRHYSFGHAHCPAASGLTLQHDLLAFRRAPQFQEELAIHFLPYQP